MFPSKLLTTFVSLPCKSQSGVGGTATGHKERLEVVGVVVGGQGSGVVTCVRRRLFEGKDEPVTTGGGRRVGGGAQGSQQAC